MLGACVPVHDDRNAWRQQPALPAEGTRRATRSGAAAIKRAVGISCAVVVEASPQLVATGTIPVTVNLASRPSPTGIDRHRLRVGYVLTIAQLRAGRSAARRRSWCSFLCAALFWVASRQAAHVQPGSRRTTRTACACSMFPDGVHPALVVPVANLIRGAVRAVRSPSVWSRLGARNLDPFGARWFSIAAACCFAGGFAV